MHNKLINIITEYNIYAYIFTEYSVDLNKQHSIGHRWYNCTFIYTCVTIIDIQYTNTIYYIKYTINTIYTYTHTDTTHTNTHSLYTLYI